MGSFRSDNRGFKPRSGGRGFGGGRGGRGGFSRGSRDRDSGRFGRRPVEMHDATCAKCGEQCQVPFRPTGNKPVLCRDCFREGGNSGRDNFGSRESHSQSGVSSAQLNQINAKLDKIIKALDIDSDDDSEEDEHSDKD